MHVFIGRSCDGNIKNTSIMCYAFRSSQYKTEAHGPITNRHNICDGFSSNISCSFFRVDICRNMCAINRSNSIFKERQVCGLMLDIESLQHATKTLCIAISHEFVPNHIHSSMHACDSSCTLAMGGNLHIHGSGTSIHH